MSLRKNVIVLVALAMTAAFALLYLTARAALSREFSRIEQADAIHETNRLMALVDSETARLTAIAHDWAPLVPTQGFLASQGGPPGNMPSTWPSLTIDLAAIVDPQAHIRYAAWATGKEPPDPQQREEVLRALWDALDPEAHSLDRAKAGLVVAGTHHFLLAAEPIPAGPQKPPRGALLLARLLDASFCEQLSEQMGATVSAYETAAESLPDDAEEVPAGLTPRTPIAAQPLSPDIIAGYALLSDLQAAPRLILRLDQPRAISTRMREWFLYLAFVLGAFCILACLIVLYALDRRVLSRIHTLSKEVLSGSAGGLAATRVTVQGRDELAMLGAEINRMLQAIEHAQGDLQRIRTAVDDASDAVIILNDKGAPLYANHAFSQRFHPGGLTELQSAGLSALHKDPHLAAQVLDAVHQQRVWTGEVLAIGADGQPFHAHLRATAVMAHEGRPMGSLLIYTDISERKALEERLRELSQIDALTGVRNRRAFDQRFSEEWRRAWRSSSPLSLLLIDIDHFKRFNDRFGHQAGDTVLRTVASTVQNVLKRSEDLLARYGGEEFAVILPCTNQEGAIMLAEKMRANVAALQVTLPGVSDPAHLSISIGISTTIPDAREEMGRLLAAADTGLYQAKDSGRNQTSFHPLTSSHDQP